MSKMPDMVSTLMKPSVGTLFFPFLLYLPSSPSHCLFLLFSVYQEHMGLGTPTHVCICTWRPEGNLGIIPPQVTSTLFFEQSHGLAD